MKSSNWVHLPWGQSPGQRAASRLCLSCFPSCCPMRGTQGRQGCSAKMRDWHIPSGETEAGGLGAGVLPCRALEHCSVLLSLCVTPPPALLCLLLSFVRSCSSASHWGWMTKIILAGGNLGTGVKTNSPSLGILQRSSSLSAMVWVYAGA